MIHNLLHKPIKTISSAAFIIGVASLLSRLLGVIRDRVLAGLYGAHVELDIYYAAFRVPDLLYNLLVVGALSAGFIPVFSHYFCKGDDDSWWCKIDRNAGWQFANNVLHVLLLAFLVAGGIFFVFTPQITKIITPGFSAEALSQTVLLSRIMFISQLFFTISSLFGGILQTFRKFVIYSLPPILYNLGIILGALFLTPKYGINGLAYGVVLGAFVHMLVQIWASFKIGYRYSFVINFKDADLRELFTLMIPRTFSLAVIQLNLLVITIFASLLSAGSLTIFNFANNLVFFPIGIFAVSFAVAAFPTFSQYAHAKNYKKLSESFLLTMRKILFFIIPITALFIILDDQIVRVVLGSGRFSWEDTITTAQSFRLLCLSLIPQALIPLFSRVFYAFKNTKEPLLGATLHLIFTILFSWLWYKPYGIAGLIMAFTIGSYINLIYVWIRTYQKKLMQLSYSSLLKYCVILMASALLLGIATQSMKLLIAPVIDFNRFGGIFLHGFVSGMTGIGVFIVCMYWLKVPEYYQLHIKIRERYVKKAVESLPAIGRGDENDMHY